MRRAVRGGELSPRAEIQTGANEMTNVVATAPTMRSAPPASAAAQRYRAAERTLWDHYGLRPTERFVELHSPAVTLRVVDVGSGWPVLFVPGSAGTGPHWGALVRELPGCRCLMLDRPGWGLSSPITYTADGYAQTVVDVLCGVLDALELERAAVVGASIGEVWALRLAARHPKRVTSVGLLGGGPIVAEAGTPTIIRLIASPLGAIMVRLPANARTLRAMLRHLGHGDSLDAGRIADEYVDWRLAFERYTDSMQSERDMVRAIVGARSGLRRGLPLEESELAAIEAAILMLYGTRDPVGSTEIWRRTIGLLPRGELRLIDGAGHMPWLDDPTGVARHISRLAASAG
jgi:2-hydroxy-6-oxonona-2,4-dienedioate hydrolase